MEFLYARDAQGVYHILPGEAAERAWCGQSRTRLITKDPRIAEEWLREHPYDLCSSCANGELI